MPIKYYLQPNPVTSDPNDQSARVVANQSIGLEGVISRLLNRGTMVTHSDALTVLTVFFDEVANLVADGNTVLLPLVNIRPGIKGVFRSVTDSFDGSRHSKNAHLSTGLLLLRKIADAKVEKIAGGYQPSPELLEFVDVSTQTVNSLLTTAGIGRISGSELKFDIGNPREGVFLINAAGAETKVTIFASRSGGTLVFSIPALTPGTYTLEVRKGYGTAAAIRTGTLSEVLTVP